MQTPRLAVRVVVVVVVAACGAAHVFLGGAHTIAVVGNAASGRGHGGAAAFAYDFDFLSLVILGLLLVIPGVICLLQLVGIARGRRAAWNRAIWSALLLAALDGALLPIQGLAVPLVSLAGAALVALLPTRPRA